MQTTKKKPSLIFILVGAVLAGYLGYLINGAWSEGVAFNEFMNRFNEVCAAPFANYYNTNTIKAVAIALGIYAMAIVMYYTSQRNYMPGKKIYRFIFFSAFYVSVSCRKSGIPWTAAGFCL